MKLWVMLKKKQKIVEDTVLEIPSLESDGDFLAVFEELGRELDIPTPVLLGKHKRELETFLRTRFFPSDFMESVSFDWMEWEIIIEKTKKL